MSGAKLRRLLLAGAVVVLLVAVWQARTVYSAAPPLKITVEPAQLLADGVSTARIRITGSRDLRSDHLKLTLQAPDGRARLDDPIFDGDSATAVLHAGIRPGPLVIAAVSSHAPGAEVSLSTTPDYSDSAADGTPDILRLDASDADAFRQWFTAIAEAAYVGGPAHQPAEIDDCAALLRFAYRETLHEHNDAWANTLGVPLTPGLPSIDKYHYPDTPLGAGLFRVRPGPFTAADLRNNAFTQFADADSLRQYNAHFVTRDIRRARPGDLLFFRQLGQHMPFHAMIYLGASHFGARGNWIVYHTGPDPHSGGELRRVTVEQLLDHPLPKWRPTIANTNFLGVYRWNILRENQP